MRVPIVGLAKLRSAAGCTGYYQSALSIGGQLQEGMITLQRVRRDFTLFSLNFKELSFDTGEELSPPCFNDVLFNLDRTKFWKNHIDFKGENASYPSPKNLTIKDEKVVKTPRLRIPT
jgi:hypothetical protein